MAIKFPLKGDEMDGLYANEAYSMINFFFNV